MRLICG